MGTHAKTVRVCCRAVMIVAAVAIGAGCSGNVGAGINGGSGPGNPGGGNGAMPGAPGSGVPIVGCRIELTAASPLSFEGLSAGPDAKLRVRAEVTGLPPAPSYKFEWIVVLANRELVPFTEPIPDDNVIQFALPEPGTYTVAARLEAKDCSGERNVVVARTGAQLRSFRFRATPPAGADLPTQDILIQVLGGTPSGGNRLQIARGIKVPLEVRNAGDNTPLPAYVRISDDNGIVFEGRSGRPGKTLSAHLPAGTYQTLVVPEGDVAPLLLPPTPATQLAQQTLSLDRGIAVDGVVRDADGAPLPNSKVILRAGTLSSTLGTADGNGAFQIRVRAGQFAGTVSPPVALGMMRAEVPVTTGITIAGDERSPPMTLGFRLRPFRTARLALALSGAPESFTGEARVVIESMAPIADVATLSVGPVNHTLSARIHGELTPTSDGMVIASTLPRGRYKATIYPAGGANAVDAVTTVTDIEVGGSGGGGGGNSNAASPTGEPAPQRVTLARKVTLRGTLLPGADAAGIEVVALDVDALLPLAFVKQVVAGGAWEMAVNPARTYTLRALPQPGQRFARASFGRVSVAAGDLLVAARNMPDALLYTGSVVDPALKGLEGVLLQMFCVAGTPDCADPTQPVAETISGPLGTFQLMLPDPGAATP